jgi:hypothetical protein
MKKALLVVVGIAFVCFTAADAHAVKNDTGKWALHNAGAHNSKTNNCTLTIIDCSTEINTFGGIGGAREDIYVIAVDVEGIAGTRYGICCDGPVYFYGWTKCSDFEIPSGGWPGCGEANAQTWGAEVPGPHVTVGILDTYTYGTTQCLSVCADPRVGFAEFCDGSEPSPICFSTTSSPHFGSIEFNGSGCGYNPCNVVPVEQRSWGAVKSIYR